MTELHKAIVRRARNSSLMYRGERRRIIVTLEAGDMIAMRLEGTRITYRAGISTIYHQMARWQAEWEFLNKRKGKK